MLELVSPKDHPNSVYRISSAAHNFAYLIQEIFTTHCINAITRYASDNGEWYLYISAPDATVQLVITAALFTAKSEWLKANAT